MYVQRKLMLLMALLILMTGVLPAQSRQKKRTTKQPNRNAQQMNMLRMWKLTEFVELTEKQGEKVFPAVRAQQAEIKELGKQKRALMGEFMEKVQNDKASRKDTDAYLSAMEDLQEKNSASRKKHFRNMKSLLDEIQYARYVIFEDHFKGQIRMQLERSPRGGNRWKPGDGPGLMFDHMNWFNRL